MIADLEENEKIGEDLRISEERLQLALKGANDGLWDYSPQDKRIYFSPRWFTMLGYSPDEFPHTFETWLRLLHSNDREIIETQVQKLMDHREEHFLWEFRMKTKLGFWKWISSRGRAVAWDKDGNIIRIVGMHTDITERKMAEEALFTSEQKFANAFHSSPDAVAISVLSSGEFIEVNRGFTQITGYSPEEALGKTSLELGIWSNPSDYHKLIETLLNHGKFNNYEAIWSSKDGAVRNCLLSGDIIELENLKCMVTITRDITIRKQAEEELRTERDFSSTVLNTISSLVAVLDQDGRIISFNRASEKCTGYTFAEVQNNFIWDYLVFPETENEDGSTKTNRLSTGDLPKKFEVFWRTKSGELRLLEWSNAFLTQPKGTIAYGMCTGIDITERKKAEADLLESHRLLSAISDIQSRFIASGHAGETYENLLAKACDLTASEFGFLWNIRVSGDGSYAIENHSLVERVSRSLPLNYREKDEALTSDEPAIDLLLRTIVQEGHIFHCNPSPSPTSEKCQIFKTLSWIKSFWGIPMKKGDKIVGILGLANSPNKYTEDLEVYLEPFISTCANIIEAIRVEESRKWAEGEARVRQEQLIQADKMKSLGILVSGVAHEINNPNSFIMVNTPLLNDIWDHAIPILEDYSANHEEIFLGGMPLSTACDAVPQLLDGIVSGAERIENIVKNLKNFARSGPRGQRDFLDINKAVQSAVTIVRSLIKKHTNHFHLELTQELPSVKGNYQEIEQVIINLLTNACQALPHKEKSITLSTSHNVTAGSVELAVIDEGIGISEENLSQITNPFYTTKRDIGGTGLGLSVSYGIIRDHGGELEFTSTPGEGTRAQVSLKIS